MEQIYRILGKKIENYKGKNIDLDKFFIDNVYKITMEILEKLDSGDVGYFLKRIPYFVRVTILEDSEKIDELKSLGYVAQKLIIKSLKYTDDEKIELLEEIQEVELKLLIVETIRR